MVLIWLLISGSFCMHLDEVKTRGFSKLVKSYSSWHRWLWTWPLHVQFHAHDCSSRFVTVQDRRHLLLTTIWSHSVSPALSSSCPPQTVCAPLYMIDWLLVKSISVFLLNMYPCWWMAPVYAVLFLFMFIHILINSATAVSVVFLISIV